MGKKYNEKEKLLEETKTEILLKAFLLKMNMFMGEEFAASTLATNNDMVESLNEFTSKFENSSNNEIAFLLIRSAILSNKNSYFIEVIKQKIAFGEYQTVLDLVNFNYAFRKNLTKNLINQSKKTDKQLYEELKNKDHVFEDLDNIKFFESITEEKIKEYKKLKSK